MHEIGKPSDRLTLFGSFALSSLLSVWQGCANDASCDPGYEVVNGSCVSVAPPPPPPSGGGGEGGAPFDPSVCDETRPATGTFGAACTDGMNHTDCACPAPICAIQPGMTTGFCTQIDCDADASVCPSGWSCFDLSVIDPSYPATCVEGS
jgi:hypothetical protein